MNDRLTKINDFLVEIEKFKLIERIPCVSDLTRRENDAEHSWHLAMMILVLKDELGIDFDVDKAIKIALVHDLVEIYTGDSWPKTREEKLAKQALEIKSAEKLFKILSDDLRDEIYDYWQEYEAGQTIEAKVVKALDKISYPLQYSISGKIVWHGVESSREEAKEYALPHIKFNQVLIDIFDHFNNKVWEIKNGKKINETSDFITEKRLKRALDFLVEIERFKLVGRIPCLSDKKTRESDADHSWHLAMMILILKDELGVDFDVSNVIKIALVHDLGEIYDGDGWASTKEEKEIKNKFEIKAAKKLFGMLPSDIQDEFWNYWQEYEKNETIEAKIVKGLDKVCYPMQYSTSLTIVFDQDEPPREESRCYAMPSMEFNPVIVSMYDYFTDRVWEVENRNQLREIKKC